MRNQTINHKQEVNDRMKTGNGKTKYKKLEGLKQYLFDRLEHARELGPEIYQDAIKGVRFEIAESQKAPPWNLDKIKVKKLPN